MNKDKLSAEELVGRWEERREIKNLMGRYAVSFLLKKEPTMFADFWSARDDVSMGLNDGWYVGREAIAAWFAAIDRATALKAELLKADLPDKLEGQDLQELYGIGDFDVKPLGTPVIELADDLKTAKGIWNVRGSTCRLTEAGPVANWIFGWAAVDFVLEDGEWKILNLLLVYNVDHQCGTAFTEPEKQFDPVPEFAAMAEFRMPEPNVPMQVMETFYPDRPKVRSPRIPEPYESFDKTFHYGV